MRRYEVIFIAIIQLIAVGSFTNAQEATSRVIVTGTTESESLTSPSAEEAARSIRSRTRGPATRPRFFIPATAGLFTGESPGIGDPPGSAKHPNYARAGIAKSSKAAHCPGKGGGVVCCRIAL
jgi:hypothetical protein